MSYVTEKIYIIIQGESLSVQQRLLSLGIVIKSKIANWQIRNCQRKKTMNLKGKTLTTFKERVSRQGNYNCVMNSNQVWD